MQIFAISGLINGIVATTFGILIISKNWRERSNQIYFFMTAALALWSFSYWQWLSSADYNTAIFLVRLLSIGSLFIPVFFFHWVSLLLGIKNKINKTIVWVIYMLTLTILFFANSPSFIANLQPKMYFLFWPNSGLIYNIYFSYLYIGLVTYTLYLLVRSYFITRETDKKGQILYIIIGSILGFGGGLTNFPLWFNIMIPPYGNFLVMAFPFFLGYSVLKYKLFNAKTIATEILVFFIAVILLVEATLSASILEAVLKTGIFIVVSIFGYLLIQSVYREVAQREKIELLAKNLEVANKAQSETMNFITHQIRGVFADTKAGLAAMIEGDLGAVADPIKKVVGHMLEAQNRGVNDVETFLKAVHIENGTVEYNMKPFDFKQLVIQLAEQEKARAESKKLKYEVHVSDGDYTIDGDQTYLGQVVSNLIDNAIRYTPVGSVEINLARKDDKIIFSIKDSGVGVNEEDGKKLFTKYGHGKDSRRINTESNGLGLFIVKGIVDGHHGKIWYESAGAGKGTTFFVELPVIQKTP